MSKVNDLLSFIEKSPTAFHAVENICRELEASGRERLEEGSEWRLEHGRGYFVTRNMSSVIAFDIPEGEADGYRLIAAHSDSPTFKIKENAELAVRGKYIKLNVERYGGMLFSTWFDRPLSVAGRVLVRTEKGMEARLINIDRDLLVIPNVAIHMNREINDGFKYNAQTDLMPLLGGESAKERFPALVAEAAGVTAEDVLGCDLFLYPRVKGAEVGLDGEYIMSPRLDDLECAWSGLTAFISAKKPERGVNMLCVFDNEEVGSGTKQGADSTFLYDVLQRISIALGRSPEQAFRAAANSFMLSADNAHAVHPNHPEKTDETNCTFMNEGVVIKFNANQRYTTDAVSSAFFHKLLKDRGIPCQHFANRSESPGGSTLGNISGSHVSINTLDIGLAQLAMHSAVETAGAKDVDYMTD
ncbi:MAG: M18 family aminopeptidase, partial [Clostridia bacterium]|nr:M18 family aminopeptidase [Clostridia bacterium]